MIKTAKQLKDLIRNLSKKKSADAQILMRNYMMERFLERISLSQYQDKFILTMEDGVTFRIKQITEIMDEAEYLGVRVSMETEFDGVRTPLKVDISTGDVITPKEIQYSFKLMLEERSINVWAYNLETVLAEKLETVISRGITNTRMRDYYDIHILIKLYGNTLNGKVLGEALLATAKKRETEYHLNDIRLFLGSERFIRRKQNRENIHSSGEKSSLLLFCQFLENPSWVMQIFLLRWTFMQMQLKIRKKK